MTNVYKMVFVKGDIFLSILKKSIGEVIMKMNKYISAIKIPKLVREMTPVQMDMLEFYAKIVTY